MRKGKVVMVKWSTLGHMPRVWHLARVGTMGTLCGSAIPDVTPSSKREVAVSVVPPKGGASFCGNCVREAKKRGLPVPRRREG